ncbi:hypothetical protein E2C01_076746 [Portunus trituberculatus]|uniref:Uncharacterized protein n=1 Tax=Portunus trituberculatus TaxID=210409 RepID=A0A5B7I9I3_PORTR|nr:hypothetical protein [Portunus trituberculatus]
MIASQVNSCLNNLAKLPASSLSQAKCLASSRPTSPKPAEPNRMQEALLADGGQGGSLGHEPSSIRSSAVMADTLLFTKRSQAKVGRSMRPAFLLLPSAWDPDVAISEILGPLAHLRPLGEDRTGCGDTERQEHPVTQSMGGGVQETAPSHPSPLSMAPEGRYRQMVTHSAAHHHHCLAPQQPSPQQPLHQHSCVPLPSLSMFLSPLIPPRWESVVGEKEDDSMGSEDHLLESSPTFTAIMDFVCEKFPEDHGPVVQDSTPPSPGHAEE